MEELNGTSAMTDAVHGHMSPSLPESVGLGRKHVLLRGPSPTGDTPDVPVSVRVDTVVRGEAMESGDGQGSALSGSPSAPGLLWTTLDATDGADDCFSAIGEKPLQTLGDDLPVASKWVMDKSRLFLGRVAGRRGGSRRRWYSGQVTGPTALDPATQGETELPAVEEVERSLESAGHHELSREVHRLTIKK